MEKKSKEKNLVFKKIIGAVTTKRLSKFEKIFLISVAIVLAFTENYILKSWVNKLKNQSVIIEILPPPKVIPTGQKGIEKPTPSPSDATLPITKPTVELYRDPFLPSAKGIDVTESNKKTLIDLKVSGILWDEKVPTAIIGTKVVKIGDILEGKIVVDIDKNKVILMEEGEIYILELNK